MHSNRFAVAQPTVTIVFFDKKCFSPTSSVQRCQWYTSSSPIHMQAALPVSPARSSTKHDARRNDETYRAEANEHAKNP